MHICTFRFIRVRGQFLKRNVFLYINDVVWMFDVVGALVGVLGDLAET